MEIRTVLLILLAALVALTIVFYQYFHKSSRGGAQRTLLATLRFVALFAALLLWVNPQFISKEYFIEKTKLVVLVDESTSMNEHTTAVNLDGLLRSILRNPDLEDRFEIHPYAFGNTIDQLDSLVLNRSNTDIAKAISDVDEIFGNTPKSILLFTDGNQTLGRDYEYLNLGKQGWVHPIVVGDTTQYEDLSVRLINTNTYAFLKNKFPLEAQLVYSGNRDVSTALNILMDGRVVHRETVRFTPEKNSESINILLSAESVGIKQLQVRLGVLPNERNVFNNAKETAIEVIDEKIKIAIVSDFLHPDIGALKKAIETNEQRTVTLLEPTANLDKFKDVSLFILYQPNRKFKKVYDHISQIGANKFTIAGTQTDWLFLNQVQNSFFKERLNQTEEMVPVLNNDFGIFGLEDFSAQGFPPLIGQLGDMEFKKEMETLMFQRIRGVDLGTPLFCILTEGEQREAVLFGENIWRWRVQSFRNDQNFDHFDTLVGKLMVYLSSNKNKSRLDLDYDLVFDDAGFAKIRASYYDESYSFDPTANLNMTIRAKDNEFFREAPILLKGSFYEIDLSDLEAGEYNFTVNVENENISKSGSFKILDFDPEKQLFSADFTKLERLAKNNNGKLYFPDQMELLIEELLNGQQYTPIQKSTQNVVSLIDFKVLLGIIALSLALEWFIRKYNGLI